MSRTLHLFGTDWCAMMVPIQVIRWYRMQCYDGTDSCAIVVPFRRYCHYIDSIMQMMGNRLQAYFVFNNTINYFRRDLYKGEEIYRRLKLLVEDGNLCIADFLDRVQKSNLGAFFAKENIKEVIDRYQAKLSCYEMKDELLLDANSGIDNRLLPYLWKVRQMVFLICVIAMISYGNFDSLYDYLGALPKPVMDKLQGEDFVAYLKSLGKEKNEHLWHDTIFLSHIKKYLYHIILA